VKVYLDNNIVSAIAKDDTPKESDALDRLLQAWDDKKIDLVTSEVALREIKAYQNELKRRLVERTYRLLAKVPIIPWDQLAGMNSYGDQRTWISTPIIQNDPDYAALLALGLKVVDAQHVFLAVKHKCDAFLTCDRGVRDRAARIKDQFGLIVQTPSDFVASQGW
jgi:predicted nucleic acid-binding protein